MAAQGTTEQRVEMRNPDTPNVAEADAPGALPARKRPSRRTLVVSLAALAVAAGGALWITGRPSSESTDDAYVAADSTTIAPKVRGLVSAILVRDNQPVRAGDPLVRIDPEEFDAKVQAARADLADAEAEVASARAAITSLDAEERLASANVIAARTSIRSSGAEAARAQADRKRYEALAATGAVARRDADVYSTAAIGAEQAAARARAMLAVSEREAARIRDQLDDPVDTAFRCHSGAGSIQQLEAVLQRDIVDCRADEAREPLELIECFPVGRSDARPVRPDRGSRRSCLDRHHRHALDERRLISSVRHALVGINVRDDGRLALLHHPAGNAFRQLEPLPLPKGLDRIFRNVETLVSVAANECDSIGADDLPGGGADHLDDILERPYPRKPFRSCKQRWPIALF